MTTNSDDLTATVHSALTALDPVRKAEFLLDTALALIDAGKYVLLSSDNFIHMFTEPCP